jgi:hypothetical protein
MTKETIESQIINMLTKGPLSTIYIVGSIMSAKKVTKEAVYKALRGLLKKEQIVKSGKQVSLSNQWVIKMANTWKQAEARYIGKSHIQMLGDKSSVVYTCKTIDQLDSLWNHAILDISYTLKPKTTLLFFSPHYWFPLIRASSEQSLIRTLTSRGHTWLQLNGYTEHLDKNLRKYFPLKEIEYHADNIKEENYINIFEDYILEITLDKKASRYIAEWYENNSTCDKENIEALEQVLKIKGVYKLKISKNKNKLTKFRKLFKKYFVIK